MPGGLSRQAVMINNVASRRLRHAAPVQPGTRLVKGRMRPALGHARSSRQSAIQAP